MVFVSWYRAQGTIWWQWAWVEPSLVDLLGLPSEWQLSLKGNDRERPQCAQARLWLCKAQATSKGPVVWESPKAFSLARFFLWDHIISFSLCICGFGWKSQTVWECSHKTLLSSGFYDIFSETLNLTSLSAPCKAVPLMVVIAQKTSYS